MKVVVTGATGYIGTAVCEAVRKAGHQVVGLARNGERAKLLESRGHLACVGDLEDEASLRAAVDGVDGVIHTAMRFDARAGERDRRAVETMLDALAGSGRSFIYSSGVWVMGDTDGSMKGEVSGLRPPPLVAWRPAVEDLVLAAKERGVEAMVLRPGMVFGRKGGALGGMFAYAREHGKVRIVGQGLNCWSTVHIDDLADLYARAVGQPAGGQLFIACGGMPQPVERIARAVAAACGLGEGEKALERISLEEARGLLGPVAECLVMDCRAGSTKAARYFGWTVRQPSIFDEIFRGSYLS
jgi:nucleoside-diphosphate-sugar epimerase